MSGSGDVLSNSGEGFSLRPSRLLSTDSISVESCLDSSTTVTNHLTCVGTASLPSDLATPLNDIDKWEIVIKGPSQPSNCHFPRRKYSNGNLSFNPTWYDLKEARSWLEYSPSADRMYCFACRLFESELREKNEPNWIKLGVCNWKKALEKIRNHYKSIQHKNAENARVSFLRTSSHIDVIYRLLVTLPVTTASCERSFGELTIVKSKIRSTTAQDRLENLMILSVENDITNSLNFEGVIDRFASLGPRRMQLT